MANDVDKPCSVLCSLNWGNSMTEPTCTCSHPKVRHYRPPHGTGCFEKGCECLAYKSTRRQTIVTCECGFPMSTDNPHKHSLPKQPKHLDRGDGFTHHDPVNPALLCPCHRQPQAQDAVELDRIHSTVRSVSRRVLYTDTVNGVQTHRDDLWAISTEELEALIGLATGAPAATELALIDRLISKVKKRPSYKSMDDSYYFDIGYELVRYGDGLEGELNRE